MRKLLNTLYVLTEDTYLSLENNNIVINKDDVVLGKVPLLNLENIIYFGYKGASPALMGACVKNNICLSFFSPRGKFLARVCGKSVGNVLLRKKQYRISDVQNQSCFIARNFIVGKLHNSRVLLERFRRDHPMSVDKELLKKISDEIKYGVYEARKATLLDNLLGIEGLAAKNYFSVFDMLILKDKNYFSFEGRTRRPPIGRVNALLSFTYSILANNCAAALEGVGLDSYVGFLHRDRPGRYSLALDLMEELRPIMADKFVITLINNRIVKPNDFIIRENGEALLNEEGRRKFFSAWQNKLKEQITHPFLKEKIVWGLVPHVQAMLLARHLRDDLEEYPAFLWN